MTFQWPNRATHYQRDAVAAASRSMIDHRTAICAAEQIGLTALYNSVDEGAYADLKKLHRKLDEAVAVCYGWPKAVAQNAEEIVVRLLELNRAIAAGEMAYTPFTG